MSKIKDFLFLIFLFQVSFGWVPKIVWTFWNRPIQEENHLLQALHRHHKVILEPKGWKVRHLNSQTMKKWLQPIKKIQQLKSHPSWQQMAPVKQSDLIRIALVGHYGGVYMDISVILTTDLDWLFDLKSNQKVVNMYGDEPEFFFNYARHSSKQEYYDPQTNQKVLLYPVIQSWLLAAKPGAKFLVDALDFAVDTIIQNYPKYRYVPSESRSIFVDIAQKSSINLGSYGKKYFQILVSWMIILGKKQIQLDQIWKSQLQSGKNSLRKFAVREYNIWTVSTDLQGYSYTRVSNPYQGLVNQDKEKFLLNNKMPYYFKFYSGIYKKMLSIFKKDQPNHSICYPQFIVNQSILYYYVLKDYPIKFYTNQIVDKGEFQDKCSLQIYLRSLQSNDLRLQKIIDKQELEFVNDKQDAKTQIKKTISQALLDARKNKNKNDYEIKMTKQKIEQKRQQVYKKIALQALKDSLKMIEKTDSQYQQKISSFKTQKEKNNKNNSQKVKNLSLKFQNLFKVSFVVLMVISIILLCIVKIYNLSKYIFEPIKDESEHPNDQILDNEPVRSMQQEI